MTKPELQQWIREIPDFPKPGILFRDISPMLRDPAGWSEVMDRLGRLCDSLKPDLILGIEARGFIVGMGLATHKKIQGRILVKLAINYRRCPLDELDFACLLSSFFLLKHSE